MLYHRRNHPYQRQNESKRTRERPNLTASRSAKTNSDGARDSLAVPSRQTASKTKETPLTQRFKIGKYLLTDSKNGSSFQRAVDTENRAELSCKAVDSAKLNSIMDPYGRFAAHENINRITDVVVGQTKAYIFMDASYGDLHSYVRSKKRLREEEACRLFRQIVRAVNHCHRAGIVLRDLKLRKFVFRNKDRTQLKLECLEDACVLNGSDDVLEDKHGCPAYVSPELLHSSGGYSGKLADIWSLGVMLYTMLVGRYPFQDVEPTVLFSKIRRGHFVIPDNLSSKVKCLIRSVMRQEPTQRLSAEEILEHPWFKAPLQSSGASRVDKRAADQTVPTAVVEDFFAPLKIGHNSV